MISLYNFAVYNRITMGVLAYADPVGNAISKSKANVIDFGYLVIIAMFIMFLLKGNKGKMWGMAFVGAAFFFITGGPTRFAPIAEAFVNYFK